jgi:hypothetical protein
MLGEALNWAKNVRASGGTAVFLLRYLELAPGARPHVPVDPGDDLAAFEKIAQRYPVFRISRAASPD